MGYCDSDKGKVDFWRGPLFASQEGLMPQTASSEEGDESKPLYPSFFILGGKARKEWFVEI